MAFAAGSIGVSNLVGPRRPNPTNLGAYESGNEPLADVPGTRFSVKFYLVAMLFLIFDVELVRPQRTPRCLREASENRR